MSAIITFARNRIAYTIAKSLAKRDIKIISCDSVYPAMTFFSKYSKSFFLYPSYTDNPVGFIKTLLKYVEKLKPLVLIPSHEETYLISYCKKKFERYTRLPIPSYEQLNIARDKTKVMDLAKKMGIPIPETFYIKGADSLRSLSETINYPAVVKIPKGRGAWGLSYVHSKSELVQTYKKTVLNFGFGDDQPFIQEYIPGEGYGVSMLFNHGELRAKFVHKRLIEYPITGGASVERISTMDPLMEKYANMILTHLNWHGVAMVEFKRDSRTGKPVLLEINPRFWGSLNQSVVAGVDFPYLLYKMAVDGDIKKVLNYKLGLRTRWFFGLVQTTLDAVRATNKTFGFSDLLKLFALNVHYDDLSFRDILTAFIEPMPYLIQLLSKGSFDIYESVDKALETIEQREQVLDRL